MAENLLSKPYEMKHEATVEDAPSLPAYEPVDMEKASADLATLNDKYRDRTYGEAAQDTAIALTQGAVDFVSLPYTAADMISGGALERSTGFGVENLERSKKILDQWKSEDLKRREKEVEETKGFFPTLGAYVENPQVALQGLTRSGPSMLGPVALGKAGMVLGKQAAMKKGAGSVAKKEAMKKGASIGGMVGVGATEGLSNAQDSKNEVLNMEVDELYKISPDMRALVDSGINKEQARDQIANQVERITFAITTPVAMAAGKLTGAAGLEGMLATGLGKFTGSIGVRALKGAAVEGAEELIQGSAGQFAGNVGTQQYVDPNQELMEGVPEAAASSIAVGSLMGGGMGAFSKDTQRKPNDVPEIDDQGNQTGWKDGDTGETYSPLEVDGAGLPEGEAPPPTTTLGRAAASGGINVNNLGGEVATDKQRPEGAITADLDAHPDWYQDESGEWKNVNDAPLERQTVAPTMPAAGQEEQVIQKMEEPFPSGKQEEAKIDKIEQADQITQDEKVSFDLSNGKSVTGTVTKIDGDVATVKVDGHGTVKRKLNKLSSIDEAEILTGEVELKGELLPAEQKIAPTQQSEAIEGKFAELKKDEKQVQKALEQGGITHKDANYSFQDIEQRRAELNEVLKNVPATTTSDTIKQLSELTLDTEAGRDQQLPTDKARPDYEEYKARTAEQYALDKKAPKKGPFEEPGAIIGKNERGEDIYQDKEGKRFIKNVEGAKGENRFYEKEYEGWRNPRYALPDEPTGELKAGDREQAPGSIEGEVRSGLDNGYHSKLVEQAYAHSSNSPGRAATIHKREFNEQVQEISDSVGKLAKTPKQKEALTLSVNKFKQDYLDNERSLMSVRSGVVSGHIAGRSKFNAKQAGRRGSALDRAQKRFNDWLDKGKYDVEKAVQDARTPEAAATDRKEATVKREKAAHTGLLRDIADSLSAMVDPGMEPALFRPKATKKLEQAFEQNEPETLRLMKVIDKALKDEGGIEKAVGTRSKFWRMYKAKRDAEIAPVIEPVNQVKTIPDTTADVEQPITKPDGEPSEAQKEAGNYKKKHVKWNSLDIAIENTEGSVRSGTDEDGKAWEVTMENDYGYIKRTTGTDGDHVDVFMGPNLTSDKVYVVNQTNADGSFDEHKVMTGFSSSDAAEKGYLANYEQGWSNYTDLAETNVEGFKNWLKQDSQKKPAKFDKPVKPVNRKSYIDGRFGENNVDWDKTVEPYDTVYLKGGEKYKAKEKKGELKYFVDDFATQVKVSPTIIERQVSETADKPAEQLKDVGEKIGGARKDIWKGFAEKIDQDLSDDEILKLPLSKTFPEPNYKKLAEQGADPLALAIIKVNRDEIPAKGRSNWKKKQYKEGVIKFRDLAKRILNNPEFAKTYMDKMKGESNLADVRRRIDLMLELDFPASGFDLKNIDMAEHFYSLYSKKARKPTGQTAEQLQTILGKTTDNVVILDKQSELPSHIQDTESVISGAYDPSTGKMYLVAENITATDSQSLLNHEVVHGVLRHSPAYKFALQALKRNKNTKAYRNAEKAATDAGTPAKDMHEEILAYYIQNYPNTPIVTRLISNIRQWLRKHFGIGNLSMAEVADMVNAMARGDMKREYQLENGAVMFHAVFHGTPHNIEGRMTTERIGTGEGAQAQGWGLYFAGERGVAEHYRKKLSEGQSIPLDVLKEYFKPGNIIPGYGGLDKVISFESDLGTDWSATVIRVNKEGITGIGEKSRIHSTLPSAKNIEKITGKKMGNLYGVDLKPTQDQYLDWDKPLTKQSKHVRDAIINMGMGAYISDETTGQKFYNELVKFYEPAQTDTWFTNRSEGQKSASLELLNAGIRGNKYMDAATRTGGKGDFNYVIFSDEDVEITAKFSKKKIQKKSAGGSFDLSNKTSTMETIQHYMQDKFSALKKVQGIIGITDEDADVYLNETLFHGKVKKRMDDFESEYVEPLMEAIYKSGKSMQEVGQYLHARHAEEANRVLKERNPGRKDNTALSGMSDNEAAKILSETKDMDAIVKFVDGINQTRLQVLESEDLITSGEAQAWRNAYSKYVPLHRTEIEESTLPARGSGYNIRGKESKLRIGSTREVDHQNLIANIVSGHEATLVRAEKNKVGQSLYKLVKENPNKDFWSVDEEKQTGKLGKDGKMQWVADNRETDSDLMVKISGKPHRISFNTKNEYAKRIVTSMKNLTAREQNRLVNSLTMLNRWLAAINTSFSPEFVISNFSRDVQTAGYNMSNTEADGLQLKVLKDIGRSYKGIRHALYKKEGDSEWAKHFDEFEKDGGRTGWLDHYQDIDSRRKSLQKDLERFDQNKGVRQFWRKLGNFVENENSAVENAVRLATYVHAKKIGISPKKAAQIAKELTVNFNKGGEYKTAMNAAYLFYNASVQGTVRMVLALKNKKVQKFVAATVVMATALDVMNRAIGGDDDDGEAYYDKIKSHIKDRNIIFMLPGTNGDYMKIPLPWGYNIFHIVGQEIGSGMSSAIGNNPEWNALNGIGRIMGSTLEAFNPVNDGSLLQTMSPTVLDPLTKIAENKDWHGGPLKPEQSPYGRPKPEYKMHYSSATEINKYVAKFMSDITGGDEVEGGWINVSPETLDMWLATGTGSVGRVIADTIDLPQKIHKGEDIEGRKIPMFRKVYGTQSEYGRVNQYYDRAQGVLTIADKLKHYRGDKKELATVRRKAGNKFKLIAFTKATERKLRKLRKQRRNAKKSGNDIMFELKKKQINAVQMKYNTRYRQIMFN